MPTFYANKEYNRSWNRTLWSRFPHAVITNIKRLSEGWIRVRYKNDRRYWKGKLIKRKQ